MPTRYIEILAVQRPFPIAVDENGRTMFSCNFNATAAAPVASFEEEVVKILTDVGIATLGTDTFIGRAAVIPKGAGPYTTIINTGGFSPLETHNGDKYERLSCQIAVRALSYAVARARAIAIWRALDGQRDITVAA